MASVTLNTAHHVALASVPEEQSHRVEQTRASAQWSPDHETLVAIVTLLAHSTTPDSKLHAQLFDHLRRHATAPDFCCYLAYVLRAYSAPNLSSAEIDTVRQAAGLLLKTNIRLLFPSLPTVVRQYVANSLVSSITDSAFSVRLVVASCISELATVADDLTACEPLLPFIIRSLALDGDVNRNAVDGALCTLARLAEDVPHLLDTHPNNPLDMVIPHLISLCAKQSSPFRAQGLQILNHLILVTPPALTNNVDAFCTALLSISHDGSAQVRKRVCTAVCLLLDTLPHAVLPHLQNLIELMLQSSAHSDPLVAREATEFWSLLAHEPLCHDALRPYLPRLVPLLITNMVYSKDDIAALDSENVADDMEPDRPEDVRPKFHQPRFMGPRDLGTIANGHSLNTSHKVVADSSLGGSMANGRSTVARRSDLSLDHDDASEDLSDDEGDFDDEDDFKHGSEWTVRKSSASALDSLSTMYHDQLLEILLPTLQEQLVNNEKWEQRECGVLALGAIAEGCYDAMQRHVRPTFQFLLHCVTDDHFVLRSISCWTLSRYSKWVISERDDSLYQQLLKVLLDRMLDRNKVVQKASCSALAAFEDESGPLLTSYLPVILRHLSSAFERYQRSNLYLLYDIVCTLADAVGSELGSPEHMNVLMPLLISKWNATADFDLTLLPLLECLASVFRALGSRSQQFAANIFSRCANIMEVVYVKESKGEKEDCHVEFLTCCLDLMCALGEALGSSVDPLVAKPGNGSKPVLSIMFMTMKDDRQEVRQSAFALLGELARARLPSLVPALPEYFSCAVEALNPEYMSVSNNASWALGELVIMAGFLPPNVPVDRDRIQRTVLEGAIDPLIWAVNRPQVNKSLLENSALTLGRIGFAMSDALAPRLGDFAEAVFGALRNIRDDVEKEQAFHGMNAMIKSNPTAILPCFVYYVDAIASWFHCKPDLEMEFASILSGYKTSLGDQWFNLRNTLPPPFQSLLKGRFAL